MEKSPQSVDPPCFSESDILDFVSGRVTSDKLGQFEEHLDACSGCRLLLSAALRGQSATGLTETSHAASGTSPTMFSPGAVVARRYRVLRFIARGGMGEVYEVDDTLLGERIALKTVISNIADDPRAVARLKYEVQTARRVTHGNVCRIFDVGIHEFEGDSAPSPESVAFITMEFLGGETLAARIARDGRLRLSEALTILEQVANGVDAAHEVGVIHRDLKSDNIMLVSAAAAGRSRAVIMDFGLARSAIVSRPVQVSFGSKAMLGTVGYMAPEQVEGAAVTAAADIYALGIILYEVLTGTLPFQGSSPLATAVKRLRSSAPALSQSVPDVEGHCQEVVTRCLAIEPNQRFITAREMVVALRTGQVPPVAGSKRRLRRLIASVGVAVIAVASALLWRAVGSRRTADSHALGAAQANQPSPSPVQPPPSSPTPAATALDAVQIPPALTGDTPSKKRRPRRNFSEQKAAPSVSSSLPDAAAGKAIDGKHRESEVKPGPEPDDEILNPFSPR